MPKSDANAPDSSWWSATRAASPARGPLTIELDVDVCVIGAGLAGLTAAREIARRGWSVAVLEAKSVGWNASGANAGVVLPGFSINPDTLVNRVGIDAAKELWRLSEAGAEYVRSAARDPAMRDVALSENGWLHVSTTDDTRAKAHEAALLIGDLGTSVEPWPADRLREVVRSPRYFHALYYPRGFTLHPLNYLLGLAASAEAAGARIFEQTEVVEVDPAGVRKRIATRQSRLRAAHVVVAGNVHLAELMPQFATTLVPVHINAIVTMPLDGALELSIDHPGAISRSDMPGHHHRVIEGGRLLWTGASTVRAGAPKRAAASLLGEIRRTYPPLRKVKADYVWSGVVGNTVHGMPQIGEISPGLWLLSGFGGHGLNTTAMAGQIVSRAILDNDTAWQAFSPFALVWAGGSAGRYAQQTLFWTQSIADSLSGVLARRREAIRVLAQIKAAKEAKVAEEARAAVRAKAAAAAASAVWQAVSAPLPAGEQAAAATPEPAVEPALDPVAAAAPAAVVADQVEEPQSFIAEPAPPEHVAQDIRTEPAAMEIVLPPAAQEMPPEPVAKPEWPPELTGTLPARVAIAAAEAQIPASEPGDAPPKRRKRGPKKNKARATLKDVSEDLVDAGDDTPRTPPPKKKRSKKT